MRRKSKKNPWRNTRNDFTVPWNSIYGTVAALMMPMAVTLIIPNLILRSGTFYSYFLSKTGIVKEIPYMVEKSDIINHFSEFMMHSKESFYLKDSNEYIAQDVFSDVDNNIMTTIRTQLDMAAVLGIVLLIAAVLLGCILYLRGEKKLLVHRFKTSIVIATIITALHSTMIFISMLRQKVFLLMFGDEFPPGDVLIQIFEADLAVYYGVVYIIGTVIVYGIFAYLIKQFVVGRKMFRF